MKLSCLSCAARTQKLPAGRSRMSKRSRIFASNSMSWPSLLQNKLWMWQEPLVQLRAGKRWEVRSGQRRCASESTQTSVCRRHFGIWTRPRTAGLETPSATYCACACAAGANQSSQLMHCAQCWLALAAAAAGMGDVEVAYHLYARGYAQLYDAAQAAGALSSNVLCANQQQQRQQQLELSQLVEQLATGKLDMLSAMCEVPPLPQHHLQQQQHTSKGHCNLAAALRRQRQQQQQHASSKRWQQLHERFSLSSSSSTSSGGGSRSRVFCVSDVHVDAPGGANMSWVKRISSTAFRHDVLIVAGATYGRHL